MFHHMILIWRIRICVRTLLPHECQLQFGPSDITLHGRKLPTPPKTWLMKMRSQKTVENVHWMTWLPLKGTRRTTWLPWLWGHVRWHNCAAPWERNPANCTLCPKQHGASVQSRLIHCQAWNKTFLDCWISWWGALSSVASTWVASSSLELWMCTCLHIPKSLVEQIPVQERAFLRRHISLFQFRALHGVQALRETLIGPTPTTATISPLWLSPYVPPQTKAPPVPTAKLLRDEVHAPWGIKPRRTAPMKPVSTIDIDAWIRQAQNANDNNGVQHILLRRTSMAYLKQQADTHLVELLETYQTLLETHSHSASMLWESSKHALVLHTIWTAIANARHAEANDLHADKTNLFVNSTTTMLSLWDTIRRPLFHFWKNRQRQMAQFEANKTAY